VRICWGSAEQNVQQFVQQKLSRALESIVFADKFIALERFSAGQLSDRLTTQKFLWLGGVDSNLRWSSRIVKSTRQMSGA
jgi:hypothetical protein